MQDQLGNVIEVGDTVIIAVKSGKYAVLGRAYVRAMENRQQFGDGHLVPMIKVEFSNISNFWLPARNVIKLLPDMVPENRRQKLHET